MEAFEAATRPAEKANERILNDTVLLQVDDNPDTGMPIADNEVYLMTFEAIEIKKGHGTQAMKFLTALASEHGIDIVLHAAGTNDKSPSDWKLVQFYKQHGFMRCGGGYNTMFRPAGGPA